MVCGAMRRLLGLTALLLGIVLAGAAPAGARSTGGWGDLTPGNLTAGTYSLSGVTAPGPEDAWVVGDVISRGVQEPLVEHWDGLAWTAVTAPLPPHTRSASL